MNPMARAYTVAAIVICAAWFAIWLFAFPNVYGWLTTDAEMFDSFVALHKAPSSAAAVFSSIYYWLDAFVPLSLHAALPSHQVPRLWHATGTFRALAACSILIYGATLGICAWFLRDVAGDPLVALLALCLLFCTPTLWFLAPLLDPRFAALLVLLPIALVPLRANGMPLRNAGDAVLRYSLPGALFGVALWFDQSTIVFVACFSLALGVTMLRDRALADGGRRTLFYALGIAVWLVAGEVLSVSGTPFGRSFWFALVGQPSALTPFAKYLDLGEWLREFRTQMGLPMMLACAIGIASTLSRRWRPGYAAGTALTILAWTATLAGVWVALGGGRASYAQFATLQPLYALFAAIGIERSVSLAAPFARRARFAVLAVLLVATTWIPASRSLDALSSHEGLGRAIAAAVKAGGAGHLYFVPTYDWDRNARAVLSREQMDALRDDDYLVTDYPLDFFLKYPDLLALFHDTAPAAAFPTEWCAREAYAERATFLGYRKWYDEPEICQSRVYRVGDLRRAMLGTPLPVASVRADSVNLPSQTPRRVFARRDPKPPFDSAYGDIRLASDVWEAKPIALQWYEEIPAPHWLEISFVSSARIGSVTIVPPAYTYVGGFNALEVFGALAPNPPHLLWSGSNLDDDAVIDATFPPQRLSRLRIVIRSQGHDAEMSYGAIAAVRFPGFRVETVSPVVRRITTR
jgi:hypothetical protein